MKHLKSYGAIFAGAWAGNYVHANFVSPKIPNVMASDLARAGVITIMIVVLRRVL